MIVFKYDSENSLQWTEIFNGAEGGTQQAVDLEIDQGGNVYILASDVAPPTNNSNILVLKYNSSGTLEWERRYNAARV